MQYPPISYKPQTTAENKYYNHFIIDFFLNKLVMKNNKTNQIRHVPFDIITLLACYSATARHGMEQNK